MKAIKITLLLVVFSAFGVSCESNTYEQISGVVANPTYNANVKGIMANNCTSCHNPDYDQSPYLQTYTDVKDACKNRNLLCRIDGSCGAIMPVAGKMPQASITIIKKWVSNGFIEQ